MCVTCGKCKVGLPVRCHLTQRNVHARRACGVKAIGSDELGRAKYSGNDKCVSCGMCMVSCPFGAICDKSQIYPALCTFAYATADEIIADRCPGVCRSVWRCM